MGDKAFELGEFLARQPSWVRKTIQGDDLTSSELSEMNGTNWPEVFGVAQDEYRELLKRHPRELREYRKRQKQLTAKTALLNVPSVPVGAPRKDWLANEAKELHEAGMSQPEIARELNKGHPNLTDRHGNPRPITPEVVRKQLGTTRSKSHPE